MLQTHLIILIVLFAVSVIALIGIKLVGRHEIRSNDGGLYAENDSEGLIVVEILAWVLSVVFFIALALALVPFNPKFWFTTTESVEVVSITSQTETVQRFGNTFESRITIELEGGQNITLASSTEKKLKVGDTIEVNCSYAYNMRSDEGVYGCNMP